MKDKINNVKHRENFRPFAASVCEEDASVYFDVPPHTRVPFMNFCYAVRPAKRHEIPAVVHEDHTTRIQTVGSENGLFYELIAAFKQKTGVAALLNTSFNVKGQPIVETPEQAIHTFQQNPIDYLYIGSFVVTKA